MATVFMHQGVSQRERSSVSLVSECESRDVEARLNDPNCPAELRQSLCALKDSKSHAREYRRTVFQLQDDIETKQKAFEELFRRSQLAETEIEFLQEKIRTLNENTERMGSELKQARDQHQTLELEKEQEIKRNDELIDGRKREREIYNQAMAELKATLRELELARHQLSQQPDQNIDKYTQIIGTLEATISQLHGEVEELKQEISERDGLIASMQNQEPCSSQLVHNGPSLFDELQSAISPQTSEADLSRLETHDTKSESHYGSPSTTTLSDEQTALLKQKQSSISDLMQQLQMSCQTINQQTAQLKESYETDLENNSYNGSADTATTVCADDFDKRSAIDAVSEASCVIRTPLSTDRTEVLSTRRRLNSHISRWRRNSNARPRGRSRSSSRPRSSVSESYGHHANTETEQSVMANADESTLSTRTLYPPDHVLFAMTDPEPTHAPQRLERAHERACPVDSQADVRFGANAYYSADNSVGSSPEPHSPNAIPMNSRHRTSSAARAPHGDPSHVRDTRYGYPCTISVSCCVM